MIEDIEEIYGADDLDLYRRYWASEADRAALSLEEEDYSVLINIAMAKQEYERAKAIVEEAMDRYPDDDEFLLCLVELLAAQEKLDEAYKVLDEIDEWHPNNEERYVLRASLYMSQERYEEAEQTFRQYEAFGGDSDLAAAGLAQCMAVRGQRQEGFKKICQYLVSDPDSIETCNRFIVWVIEWEMLDEAAVFLRRMTFDSPYNKHLWKLLYEVCELMEDYEGAKDANEYTLAIDPEDYEAHGRRILYADLYEQEAVEESFRQFQPEKWTDTQRLYLYNVIADYYANRNDPDKEAFYIKKLLDGPLDHLDRATLSYRLASRIFRRDDAAALKEALFHFRKAESIVLTLEKPEPLLVSDIERGIGQCMLLLGESEEESMAYLHKAWRTCPDNELAAFDYFLNLCVLERLDEALAEIETALSEMPDHPSYLLLKGAILYYMHKPRQSVAWFEKAMASGENMLAELDEAVPDIMQDPYIRKALGVE